MGKGSWNSDQPGSGGRIELTVDPGPPDSNAADWAYWTTLEFELGEPSRP